MQNPAAGFSPAPGAPRSPRGSAGGAPSAPLPGVSPLSPPQPSPSLFPVPPGTAGTNHSAAGAGGFLAVPCAPPPRTTARKTEAAPSPPLRAGRWNVPAAAVPLPSARGERSGLTPPLPCLGFARPPAMAGEGRACCTAASPTRLPKPRLSRYRGAAGGWGQPRAGALGAAPLNQSSV